MDELKPQESEALDILESMLDVADMKCTGPLYADDPPRNGLCRIPEEDAVILRQYITARRAAQGNEPLICPLLSDDEVKQPCVEGPCPVMLNEPLKLEHLRQMDGEPVWVGEKDKRSHIGGWGLVDTVRERIVFNRSTYITFRAAANKTTYVRKPDGR